MILLSGCSEESKAKSTVNNYLKYIKNGDEEKAWDYANSDVDDLIDVFDYKYLRTMETKKEDNITDFSRELFESPSSLWKDDYDNFEDFKKHLEQTYNTAGGYKVVENSDNHFIVKDKENPLKIYTLLYDTEIANEIGNKLYKKIEFTVTENDGKFEITDINIR